MRDLMFAISATAFAAIFLVAIIVFGDEMSRKVAIFAAFLATVSQFTGPDPQTYRFSLYSAYAAFVSALFAFIVYAWGF